MSTYPTPLVPRSGNNALPLGVEAIFQIASLIALGYGPPAQGQPYYPSSVAANVQPGWQDQGQPFPAFVSDMAFVRAVEIDDEYNSVRDVMPFTSSSSINTIAIQTPGTGYTVGDILNVVQMGGIGGQVLVTAIVTGGALSTAILLSPGTGYAVANNLPLVGGTSGSGATVNITGITGTNAIGELVTYTRVWEIYWTFYGSNSFDRARQVRSGLLYPNNIHDFLSAYNLYLVTRMGTPRRSKEKINRQWWERVDFYARFNEAVAEVNTDPTVASAQILVYNANGLQETINAT